ncbi:MAG: hypothetical protein HY898_30520 [Deltaproteobacteria bacterium]|nr:hypothetical protein [Deltaproteobacteria bacterium]
MKTLKMPRRRMMAVMGAAAALVPAVAASAAEPKRARAPRAPRAPAPSEQSGSALVAPLVAGSALGSWRVVRTFAVRAGAVSLELKDSSDRLFYLDICKRDRRQSAPKPPACTDLYDIFVANEGDGSAATLEDHGLAAMAVAEVVRANEHAVPVAGMLTLRERLRRHPDQVMRGF